MSISESVIDILIGTLTAAASGGVTVAATALLSLNKLKDAAKGKQIEVFKDVVTKRATMSFGVGATSQDVNGNVCIDLAAFSMSHKSHKHSNQIFQSNTDEIAIEYAHSKMTLNSQRFESPDVQKMINDYTARANEIELAPKVKMIGSTEIHESYFVTDGMLCSLTNGTKCTKIVIPCFQCYGTGRTEYRNLASVGSRLCTKCGGKGKICTTIPQLIDWALHYDHELKNTASNNKRRA